MKWLRRWLKRMFWRDQWTAHEAIQRFMMPQAARLHELGLSDYEIYLLGVIAIERADYTFVYPGVLFRDMVDTIERGETTAAEIIHCHHNY